MKKRFQQSLLLFFALLLMPLGAWADREVNQLQFGKQVITVASDEVITFKDPKGDTDYSGTQAENAQSLTIFQPAEVGMSIQITFESMNMGGSNNYYSFANVYSGNPDADDSFTWAASTSDVSTSYSENLLPSGTILRAYPNEKNKTYTDETYISASADGIISVGFAYRYAYSCSGWVAKVKAIKLENMTITGAGSSYDGIGGQLTTKQNVALVNAFVTATGVMNPDNVTGIYFTMTKNEGVVDPTSLKLFKGDTQVTATVESDGDNYKFVLNEAPADGTTTFTVKGDFLGTAAVGAKVQVDITKVTTAAKPEGIAPFAAGTAVEIENPALVFMTAVPQTVTVDETPLMFFDEGGKDGGIVSKTNGQVTFLSGVAGKKVMVDFTKNNIWHGSYYNQELRIYSGTEVKADALIRTLQQGETALVRSTAADGSLTVVLFSDASNDIAADGFEATVSLFTPQHMDFNGLAVAAASAETVAAGDAEQDMLNITVKTQNTEPAMQVKKMAFTAGDNFALVSKASLYFGSTKVGEAVLEGAAFEMTLTEPQTLVEGDNLFTLKYDISDEALNDQKVSAQLVSVTALVNNAEKTETATEATAAERTVKNIVLSHADQGTVTKKVNGSLAFETKNKNEYSNYCEAGTDNRINVFVPKHEGMVCQIDFSEFNVQYSSTSYGNKSTFRIYAGQGTGGELLWELNDNAQESVGPEMTVRSTAADGSMTIVFNPNSSSYYYNGFKATVSEYLSKNMEVTTVEAAQATTADASIGAANQELLSVNVMAEGNLNLLSMSSMKLNLKGTEANIEKVSVWKGDTKLGETVAAAEVEVTFAEAVELAEGNNLFTVKADISSAAEENATVDAALLSVTVGGNSIAATAGDPEGARILKNLLLMTAGNHGTMNLALGKQLAIYDDGGAEGDGADGVEAVVTIAPTGDAESIKLSCLGISFGYTAHLYIYEGTEATDEKELKHFSGSDKPFEPFVVDGPVTIKYIGKGSYTKPNFGMVAEGYNKVALAVDSIVTEDISTNEVLKGQTDVKMIHAAIYAKGDLESLVVTKFNITENEGTAANELVVYQTGHAASFSPTNVFNGEYTIEKEGVYHFWIVANIDAEAAVGREASATLASVTVNGADVAVKEPSATAKVTVASGKSGTYTVGEGADYATIQGAIDDFGTLGIEGPVVLKIKAGSYNEKVRIPYIKGMGATNTLTVESESGERDVKIYHDNYTTGGYSDDQHKKDYGVVTLYEASYVTLRNLEITTTDLNYKAVVMIKDESRHATIDNCYLHTEIYASTSGDGPALVGHTIIDEENRNNDYLTVKNCLLEGGKYGVNIGGTSTVALPKEVGSIIEGNTFKNNGRFMLYSYDELGAKIRNNTFIIDNADVKMSNGVIDINVRDEHAEATEITGNIFNLASANTLAAIYVRQMEATAEAPAIIANNVLNITSPNASTSPLKFNGAKIKHVNVAHNTIRMTGENGGAAFWAASTLAEGYGNVNVVNNIIQNETSGYAVNLYNDNNLGTDKINFQNNIISTAGETFFRASSSTTGDFAAFVEKTGATGCINKQAQFVSNDILEPASTLDGDLLKALKLSYVTTDVNGTVRPEENISIGAYEYDPDLTRVPVVAEGYPKAQATAFNEAQVAVKADMNGKAYVLVLAADAETPAASVLKNSELTMTLTKDTEATLKVTGLDAETAYKAFVLVESTRGNATEVLATEAFTTPMEPIELMIACTNEPVTTVASGTETALKVMVAQGRAPYTVTWTNSKHEVVGEPIETSVEGEDIVLNITPTASSDYYVTIKDAQQFAATDTCRIIVTGPALAADFENLYLEPNSYWRGPDTKGDIEEGIYGDDQYQGSFLSGSFKFSNNYSIDWGSWSGFSYSNRTATEGANIMKDQWNACTGSGFDGSENYAVFFEDSFAPMTVSVVNNPEGEQLTGFYITNAAVAVNAFVNGDGITEGGFTTGDFFKLIITADNDKSLEYYLADYRSENAADHYYINDWQWVDLSSLGTVKELTFHMESSRKNSWGYTTPLYFCMDNFAGEAPHEGPATMEDLELADESYWNGSDGKGSFISGGYRFENGYELSDYGAYAYGFFYSNQTHTTHADWSDMYNSIAGHGAENSKTYAVFNVNEYTPKGVEVLAKEGEVVSGFYVTNSAYSYASIIKGDDYAKKFGMGDWFKLTVTGYDAAGESTGTVDFYLADLRDANYAYIVNDWRWVDLTSLGKVKRLGFTMSSSDSGQWGMNTPAYFCLDNLGGTKPEHEDPIPTGIVSVKAQNGTAVERYDLGGRKLNKAVKGVQIMRMPDGSIRKIMVK